MFFCQDLCNEDEIVVHLPDFDPVDVDHFINSFYGWREHKDDIFITQLHKLLYFGTHWIEGSSIGSNNPNIKEASVEASPVEHIAVECQDIADENEGPEEVNLESDHQNEIPEEQDSWENVEIKIEDEFKNEFVDAPHCEGSNLEDSRGDFSCNECDFFTFTPTNLQRHMMRMHPTVQFNCKFRQILRCKVCDFTTNKEDQIKIHTECKHKNQTIPMVHLRNSNIKGKISKNTPNLTKQIKSKQPSRSVLQCDFLGFSSRAEERITIHTDFNQVNVEDTINEGSLVDTNMKESSEQLKQECLGEEEMENGDKGTKRKSKKNGKEKSFLCEQCAKPFKSKRALKLHDEGVHKTIKYHCDKCDFLCYGSRGISIHKHKVHKQAHNTYPCDQCDYVTDCSSELKIHIGIKERIKIHTEHQHQNQGVTINQGSLVDTNIKESREHTKQECLEEGDINDRDKGIECKSKESEKSFLCEQCAKSFKSKYSLRLHVEGVHKTKEFHCDKCDFSCYGSRVFSIHKWKVHTRGPQSYFCDQCDFVTRTGMQLKDHIEIKHQGRKFSCTLCDYVAYYSTQLKRHIRNVHENVRYSCDECDKVLNSTSSLNRHKDSIHRNVRLPCPECGQILRSKSDLSQHIRLHHKGPILQCEFCDFSTRANYLLKNHKLQRHNERQL